VRHECLRQLRTSSRHVELTETGRVRDDSVDLDAGLRTEQYRELIWTAAAGLNPATAKYSNFQSATGLMTRSSRRARGIDQPPPMRWCPGPANVGVRLFDHQGRQMSGCAWPIDPGGLSCGNEWLRPRSSRS
jgi:hypothetical protein